MRAAWATAQIIESYRGQSRVERALRDLKDPWACAFQPQYHSTGQKFLVHALVAMLNLLLGVSCCHERNNASATGEVSAIWPRS